MTRLQSRLAGAVDRLGDTFTVSAVAHRGVVSFMSPVLAQRFLTAAAYGAGSPPWLSATVSVSDTTGVGAVATWNGASYTVRGVLPLGAYGQTVAKQLVLSL